MQPNTTFDYKNSKGKTEFVVVNVQREVCFYSSTVYSVSYTAGICGINLRYCLYGKREMRIRSAVIAAMHCSQTENAFCYTLSQLLGV